MSEMAWLRELLRRKVPGPLRSLLWRAKWARSQNKATSRIRIIGRLVKWTTMELAGQDLTVNSSDGLIMTSPARNFTAFSFYITGANDPEFERFIRNRLHANDVFLDVGANVGAYSLFASKIVGDGGRVVSLEAQPSTFAYLEKNVRDNRLINVTCLNEAAAAESGSINIASNAWNAGETHVAGTNEQQGVKVRATRIDELIGRLGLHKVDYIKIDVEGFELPALRGARDTLVKNNNIVVQTELVKSHLSRYGHNLEEVCALMGEIGLKPFRIDFNGLPHLVSNQSIGSHCDVVWMKG